MNVLVPIVFFGLPLAVAFKLCGWQVVASFLIAIFIVPFCVVFFTHLLHVLISKQGFNFKECLTITALFAIPGIPIYFLLILPLYYVIQTFSVNFYVAFPCVVSVIMVVIAKFLENEPQPLWVYIIIIGCGIAHSLLIIWLIAKFKLLSA